MVIRVTDHPFGLPHFRGREFAVADELHKLVPFRMTQTDHIVRLADRNAAGVDNDLGTSTAYRTKTHRDGLHGFHLLPTEKVGIEAGLRSSPSDYRAGADDGASCSEPSEW